MSEKYRFLHVEDDVQWQKLLSSRLKDDCRTTTCSSIEEVLTLIKGGKTFDLAAVDLTIDRSGSEWEITTPEELILYLKSQGIGVAILSGVPDSVIPQIETKLGVKVVDKGRFNDFQEVIAAALLGYSQQNSED